jgi:hypothetical protein
MEISPGSVATTHAHRAIGLMHPKGVVGTAWFRGRGYDESIIDAPLASRERGVPDLLLLVPDQAELRSTPWMAEAYLEIRRLISRGGIVYVLVPPHHRSAVKRQLHAMGLASEPYVHSNPGSRPSFIAPITAGALRSAVEHTVWLGPRMRVLYGRASRLRLVRRGLERFAPTLGYLVHAQGLVPFGWLSQITSDLPGSYDVVVRPSWRGASGAGILQCVSRRRDGSSLVVKVAHSEHAVDAVRREYQNLERFGACAIRAGAQVASPITAARVNGLFVAVQTALEGVPAALVLRRSPDRIVTVIDLLGGWLQRWYRSTALAQTLTEGHVARWLWEPLDHLRAEIDPLGTYQRWLEGLVSAISETCVPVVAAHSDLTMTNVLFERCRGLGIVDWEVAESEALPLTDFFYAVTDAIVATHGMSRQDAFRAGFAGTGEYRRVTEQWLARLAAGLDLTGHAVELALHSCWLHHARNEATKRQATEPRPYLDLLRWLARNPDAVPLPGAVGGGVRNA